MQISRGIFFIWTSLLTMITSGCAQTDSLKKHLLFYSSFDGTTQAQVAQGDARIYSAENYRKADQATAGLKDPNVIIAPQRGVFGDAIHFKQAQTDAVFYKAQRNVGYSATSWSGSISFWLRLDPDRPLAPHYCDPICITDKQWNDGAMWVDFTDHNPRKFRMGAMGDLAAWNPDNSEEEQLWEMRSTTVEVAPMNSKDWTHVVMTYSGMNTKDAAYHLYLDGQLQGSIQGVADPFIWEIEQGKIMLGLGYIGFMDELAVFDKALSATEVAYLFRLPKGIQSLLD